MNIALAPTTVRPSAPSTGPRVSTRSSAIASLPSGAGKAGSVSRSAAIVATPSADMPQNDARQPRWSPAQVASGTPTTFAIVRPMNIAATAPARRSAGTRLAATIDPTPKNAPWLNEVRIRAAISMP